MRAPMMRTLGPGSVSSFLKVVLDVVYVVLLVATGLVLIGELALLVALPFAAGAHIQLDTVTVDISDLASHTPALAAVATLVALNLCAVVVVLNRLRRVFGTLTLGDPFQPENVGRLRIIGLALIAIQAIGQALHMSFHMILPWADRGPGVGINLSAWFSILVVFVLAEVFREGARLRRDAELTI